MLLQDHQLNSNYKAHVCNELLMKNGLNAHYAVLEEKSYSDLHLLIFIVKTNT